MAGRALRVTVMVLGMLAMLQHTMQLKITHPLPNLENKDQINSWPLITPFIGIILSSNTNEKALENSDLWKPYNHFDIAGRRFRVGALNEIPVVAVVSGSLSAQASVTTQIMLNNFRIRLLVHIGSALTIDDTFSIGSVSVVKAAAFTGYWTWEPLLERLSKTVGTLKFGDYNFPNPERNYMGSLSYEKVEVFKPEYTSSPEKAFFHEVDSNFYDYAASRLKFLVDLKQCYNSSHCLPKKPELTFGLKTSTSDIYLKNSFYGKFLHKTFNVSTVDTQSATVMLTAQANGMPIIVFRAASNSLDLNYDSGFKYLASENVVAVATQFVALFPPRADVQSY